MRLVVLEKRDTRYLHYVHVFLFSDIINIVTNVRKHYAVIYWK